MSENRLCWNVSFIDKENDLFETSFMGSQDDANRMNVALECQTEEYGLRDVHVYERVTPAKSRSAADVLRDILNAATADSLSSEVAMKLAESADTLGTPNGSDAERLYDVSFVWLSGPNAFGDSFWSQAGRAKVNAFALALGDASVELDIEAVGVEEPQDQENMQDLYGAVAEIEDVMFVTLDIEEVVDGVRVGFPR